MSCDKCGSCQLNLSFTLTKESLSFLLAHSLFDFLELLKADTHFCHYGLHSFLEFGVWGSAIGTTRGEDIGRNFPSVAESTF